MKLTKKAWAKLSLALLHVGITDAAALVCMVIIHHAQSAPAAIDTLYIADSIGHCKRTVLRSVQALETAGLITVQRRPGLPSVYALTDRCRELCASALAAPGSGSRASSSSGAVGAVSRKYCIGLGYSKSKKQLTQAEIDDLNDYLTLSNRFDEED